MEYGYTQQLWSPPRGRTLEEVRAFLQRMGLSYAQGIEHTAVVRDGTGAVAATASLEGHVIKCVAVDPDAQGALRHGKGVPASGRRRPRRRGPWEDRRGGG